VADEQYETKPEWWCHMKVFADDDAVNLLDTEAEEGQGRVMNVGRFFQEEEEKPKQISDHDANIVTSHSEMEGLISIARRVAKTDVSVLILGETGVGKEAFAQFIQH